VPRRPSTHVDSPRAVGERLRAERERAGFTQRELAFEGCTAAYISRIETGERVPSLQILRELGRRLGVSPDYLATGDRVQSDLEDPLFDAELAARLGERDRARAIYDELLATAAAPELIAEVEAGLGRLAFDEGDHERAIPLLERAISALPEPQVVETADRLGRAYALTGRFEEALAVFTRFLERGRERGDALETIRFSVLLANAEIDRGDSVAAARVLSQVLETTKSAIDPIARAGVFWSQSRLHASQGEPALATRYARLALGVLETTEHTGYIAQALLLVASLENDNGRSDEALALIEDATPLVQAAGNRYNLGYLQLERARALLGLGHPDEAAGLALGSLPLLATASPTNAARGYALAASIFRQAGERERALELYELAAESFPSEDRHTADVYSALAEIAEEDGRTEDALRYLKRALGSRRRESVP
jgi:tetratricopeptide (TPR) repeat protein